MGIHCADHVTPLYPQKLALTSPTGGGRSVGIVRSRTKATEFSFYYNSLRCIALEVCVKNGKVVNVQFEVAEIVIFNKTLYLETPY